MLLEKIKIEFDHIVLCRIALKRMSAIISNLKRYEI